MPRAPRAFLATGLTVTAVSVAVAQESSPPAAAVPSPQQPQAAGLLPVPDYAGDLGSRRYLSGDWGGIRPDWADRGVQLRLEWYQAAQGVVDGGTDERWAYGTNLDLYADLDLDRMGVLPGALVSLRTQSRFGDSVNTDTGLLLPVNTVANFPFTDTPDRDVALAVTELNYTQFLSERFGLVAGKITTLEKANEFAGGEGRTQFLNFQFLFPAVFAQVAPYSTLAAGAVVLPSERLTLTSIVMNTADASTTTGFSDVGEGTSWWTSADLQYELGGLPGGTSLGVIYAFDGEFTRLGGINYVPGAGLMIPRTRESWALQWTGWQYLCTEPGSDAAVDPRNGRQDRQGLGLFATLGLADEDTNPVRWSAALGLGARGLIPGRDDDTLGAGWFYNDLQEPGRITSLLLDDTTQGAEVFYNVAVTPAVALTVDLQWVSGAFRPVDDSYLVGFRCNVSF